MVTFGSTFIILQPKSWLNIYRKDLRKFLYLFNNILISLFLITVHPVIFLVINNKMEAFLYHQSFPQTSN